MHPSLSHLMARAATTGLADSFTRDVAAAHAHHVPLRVDEINSVSCGADRAVRLLDGFWRDNAAQSPVEWLLNLWAVSSARWPVEVRASPYLPPWSSEAGCSCSITLPSCRASTPA